MSEAARDLTDELVDRRFRVERKLGSGGMGTVWQVQHVESLQRFALKTLASELARDQIGIDRFLREARAAAALRTRHVVRVIDVQMGYQHAGEPLPFIVMELLEGFDLEQLVTVRGRLSPGETLWVLRQIGRALGVAHRRGVVHRDLKAANVFIALDEEHQPIAKLCDFGIAKLVSDSARGLAPTGAQSTGTGAFLGTPLYMAPEQLSHDGTVGPATDQWALALIAYRALSGTEYFGRASSPTDLVIRIARDPLPTPSALGPRLPPGFDAWFMRSCARDPSARHASVDEQIERLDAALGHPTPEPLVPRLVPPSEARPAERDEIRSTSALVGTPRPERRGLGAVIAMGALTIATLFGIHATAGTSIARVLRASLGLVPSTPASTAAGARTVDVASPASAPRSTEAPTVELPNGAPSLASTESAPAASPVARMRGSPSERPAAHGAPAASARRTTESRAAESRSPAAPPRRPRGEACATSAECESGLCLAEACR
jgi:eukaryotic-like serine/threonine-protein kinase